jgi:hypothetical protein
MSIVAWSLTSTFLTSGASYLLLTEASRPAFFTSGGPLFAPLEEIPRFVPAFWKRRCLGLTWTEQRPNGEWLGCAGVMMGARLEYRNLKDKRPWTPREVPSNLDALAVITQIGHANYVRGAVLSWRYAAEFEEILLAAEHASGHWALARAYRRPLDSQPVWQQHMVFDEPITAYSELLHQPNDIDLAQFTIASGWTYPETDLHILDWAVSPDAWAWTTGNPGTTPELRNEIIRLKSYTTNERRIAAAAGTVPVRILAPFVVAPGQSVVLPESAASEMKKQCSRVDIPDFEATWTPTTSDIEALESKLHELNPVLSRGAHIPELRQPLHRNVNDYHRQYCGLIVEGLRLIYINALQNTDVPSTWRKEPFGICDGGAAAWGVIYDPAEKRFWQLYINGVG